MSSSGIRLRYSILVNYLASIYRLVAAVAFAIIVIRKLGIYEFGIWTIAFSLANFFSLPSTTWLYWTSRFVARGFKEAAPTGGALTAIYALVASGLFEVAAWLVSRSVGGFEYLATYGLALMLSMLLNGWLGSIVDVVKPEVSGYSGFIFHSARVALAYILVALMHAGLSGAFVAVISARLITIAFLAASMKRCGVNLVGKPSRELAISWLKRAYIPFLNALDAQVRSFDRTLAAAISGSASVAAFMGAAYVAQTPVGSAGASVVAPLRARLLRKPSAKDIEEATRMVMLFGCYTLATLATLAVPILTLLNPRYASAYIPFILAAVTSFIQSFSLIYITASIASEKSDLELNKSLLRTRLFRTPLAKLAIDLAALGTGCIATYLTKDLGPVAIATAFIAAWLVASIAIAAVAKKHLSEEIETKFPWRDAATFTIATIATIATYIALKATNITIESFWRDTPKLLTAITIGACTYIATLYITSPWFRQLTKLTITKIITTQPSKQ